MQSYLFRCCIICWSACWQKHTIQCTCYSFYRCCVICWSACWQKHTMCSQTVQKKSSNSTSSLPQFGPLADVCKFCFVLVLCTYFWLIFASFCFGDFGLLFWFWFLFFFNQKWNNEAIGIAKKGWKPPDLSLVLFFWRFMVLAFCFFGG